MCKPIDVCRCVPFIVQAKAEQGVPINEDRINTTSRVDTTENQGSDAFNGANLEVWVAAASGTSRKFE